MRLVGHKNKASQDYTGNPISKNKHKTKEIKKMDPQIKICFKLSAQIQHLV
jgi:hypothetical protein